MGEEREPMYYMKNIPEWLGINVVKLCHLIFLLQEISEAVTVRSYT